MCDCPPCRGDTPRPSLPSLHRSYITDADFDVGGPLHHVQMELLLWASYRGQLLSRTVRRATSPGWPRPIGLDWCVKQSYCVLRQHLACLQAVSRLIAFTFVFCPPGPFSAGA